MKTVTIRHTAAQGTTLQGVSPKDEDQAGYNLANGHGFRHTRTPGTMYMRGSRDKTPREYVIGALKARLESFGYTVTVDIDTTTRPTAEVEADRTQRAQDRAEHLDTKAAKLRAESDTAHAAADRFYANLPLGQPVLTDHYSAGADINRRKRASNNRDKGHRLATEAKKVQRQADTAASSQEHREAPAVTTRRIEKLEADLRGWKRTAKAEGDTEHGRRAQLEITQITEQITYWQAHLAALISSGTYDPWTREHFRKGDLACVRGTWREVVRVNGKTLTVRSDYSWNGPAAYDSISGRRRDGMHLSTPSGTEIPAGDADALEFTRRAIHAFPGLTPWLTAHSGRYLATVAAMRSVLPEATAQHNGDQLHAMFTSYTGDTVALAHAFRESYLFHEKHR